jgi:SAM-dependent methyltransferase
MTDDARRVLEDYGHMSVEYAEDAEDDPSKVAYDRPAILAMAGDLQGQRVLEVGCATGALTEALVERGATVDAIDINPGFIARAQARLGGRAAFHVADIAAPLPLSGSGTFDLVVASLVLHYVLDWTVPLGEFARLLRPGGALVLSTHNPVAVLEIAEPTVDYLDTVLVTDTWRKGGRTFTMRFYHRPLSAIVDALADAGFLIERIPEPLPDADAFAASPDFYERMTHRPMFLFVRAIKPRWPVTFDPQR